MADNFRENYADEMQRALDPYLHAITTIDENHRLIHDGFFFQANYYTTSVLTGTSVELLLAVPAGAYPHLQELRVSTTSGPDLLSMYEGTTTSSDGTALLISNKNRNSTNTASAVLTHTPTITDDGTKLSDHLIAVAGKDAGIFTQDRGGEWLLKPDTKYLFRFTNNSGGNADVELHFYWYEVGYEL